MHYNPHIRRIFMNCFAWVVALGGWLMSGSFCAAVTLAWDASTDASTVGYRLHYGTSSGTYTSTVDVGNVTTATVSTLQAGTTYFFAATAYDASSAESAPS